LRVAATWLTVVMMLQISKLNTSPAESALAINSTVPPMMSYFESVAAHLGYWAEAVLATDPHAERGKYNIADWFQGDFEAELISLGHLSLVPTHQRQTLEYEKAYDQIRGDIVGNLALSRLCRGVLAGRPSKGATGEEEPWANVLAEPLFAYPWRPSVERRLHLPDHLLAEWPLDESEGPDAAPLDTWFKVEDEEGILYVWRPVTATPSPQFEELLQTQKVTVHFQELGTLFPYLPATEPTPGGPLHATSKN
jgi:hypothetical protein